MKILILFIYFYVVLSDKATRTIFENYVCKHQRKYGLKSVEANDRYIIFKRNLAFIEERNSMGLSYRLGITEFTDRTYDEFKKNFIKRSDRTVISNSTISNTLQFLETVPSANGVIDWSNYISPVKDQKTCGSCWAFSAVGSVESNFNLKYNSMQLLSEQELVDCGSKYSGFLFGCGGGNGYDAQGYIQKNGISRGYEYKYSGYSIGGMQKYN